MGMGMKMNFVPYSECKISLQQAYMYLIQDTCILFLVYHCLLFILVAAYHNLDRHKTVSIALRHENLMVVLFDFYCLFVRMMMKSKDCGVTYALTEWFEQ